jgi:hypothetical protein
VRINHIIGVNAERIVTGPQRPCGLACRGEIVNPHEIKHPRPELARNLLGPIGRARIDGHNLIKQAAD